MSTTDNPKLAVLIDADNASATLVKELLEEVAKFGTATVKRAYGDWTGQQLTGWKDQLNRYAIQPIQQFAYTRGKNSTDASLIIDAMDLLYADNVDGFCLVSSDSDFTRLATRLRESRKVVYGLGERKTPEAFRAACDRFVFFEVLKRGGGNVEATTPVAAAAIDVPDLEHALRQAFDAVSRDNGWATLSSVGSYMAKNNPSFDTRLYGFRKLSDMVRKQPFVEAETVDGANGPLLMVRLRQNKQPPAPVAGRATRPSRARRGQRTGPGTAEESAASAANDGDAASHAAANDSGPAPTAIEVAPATDAGTGTAAGPAPDVRPAMDPAPESAASDDIPAPVDAPAPPAKRSRRKRT